MITARFINPLFQFNKKEFDLVIEQDGQQVFRVNKSFSNNITQNDLNQIASDTISMWQEQNQIEDTVSEEITIDLPDGENL